MASIADGHPSDRPPKQRHGRNAHRAVSGSIPRKQSSLTWNRMGRSESDPNGEPSNIKKWRWMRDLLVIFFWVARLQLYGFVQSRVIVMRAIVRDDHLSVLRMSSDGSPCRVWGNEYLGDYGLYCQLCWSQTNFSWLEWLKQIIWFPLIDHIINMFISFPHWWYLIFEWIPFPKINHSI